MTTLRLEPTPLSDLLAMRHKRNPKEHSIPDLIDSFVRFGFVAFATVDEASGVLVAGHGRCEALERMRAAEAKPPRNVTIREEDGEWMVPLIRGISFENEKERDAYLIADNQQAMGPGWNFDALSSMLRDLAEGGRDAFVGMAFETLELDSLLGLHVPSEEPPDDGFDPGVRANGSGGDGPKTKITAIVTCPECGHEFER